MPYYAGRGLQLDGQLHGAGRRHLREGGRRAAAGRCLSCRRQPHELLARATAPGNVAEDRNSTSGNGPYTQFLVQEIQRPNARIGDVCRRVRFQGRERSQGRQIPWESTSLEDDFYFGTGIKPFVRIDNKALAESRLERLHGARVKAQPDRDGKTDVDLTRRFREGDRFEFVIKDGLTGVLHNTASVVWQAVEHAHHPDPTRRPQAVARRRDARRRTREGRGDVGLPKR